MLLRHLPCVRRCKLGDRLPKPQSDELELLKELPDFREATSRLSCQVDFTEELSGLKVAIAPDS